MFIDFLIRLLISKKCKKDVNNSILVIVDRLIKKVHYKLVIAFINKIKLAKIIIDVIIKQDSFFDSIIRNFHMLFM